MKKNITLTVAIAGIALTACGKKDSYKSVRSLGGGGSSKVTETAVDSQPETVNAETTALEILSKDVDYTKTRESSDSADLKESLRGIEVLINDRSAPTPGLSDLQISVLSKSAEDCMSTKTLSTGFSRQALEKGIKIKGQGKVQCVEKECNHLLLVIQKTGQDFPGGSLPKEVVVSSTAVLLEKNESGLYQPVTTQSDEFAKLQNIDKSTEACMLEKSKPKTVLQTSDEAIQQLNAEKAQKEEMNARLSKMTLSDMQKRLLVIDYKLRNPQLSAVELKQLRSERDSLTTRIQEIKSLPQTSDEAIQKLNAKKGVQAEVSDTAEPKVVDPQAAE